MITLTLGIDEINTNTGKKSSVLSYDLRSLDKFIVEDSQVMTIKMLSSKVIKISDLVQSIDSVSSVVILSNSSTDNTFPLFDVSVLDPAGAIVSTTRCNIHMIMGAQGLTNDLQIDNMEERGDSPELSIVITTK